MRILGAATVALTLLVSPAVHAQAVETERAALTLVKPGQTALGRWGDHLNFVSGLGEAVRLETQGGQTYQLTAFVPGDPLEPGVAPKANAIPIRLETDDGPKGVLVPNMLKQFTAEPGKKYYASPLNSRANFDLYVLKFDLATARPATPVSDIPEPAPSANAAAARTTWNSGRISATDPAFASGERYKRFTLTLPKDAFGSFDIQDTGGIVPLLICTDPQGNMTFVRPTSRGWTTYGFKAAVAGVYEILVVADVDPVKIAVALQKNDMSDADYKAALAALPDRSVGGFGWRMWRSAQP